MNTSDALREFVLLWSVVDPIGTIPVYLAAAVGLAAEQRRIMAVRAVAIAAGVLLFFAVAGEALLAAMSIPLAAFQVAGGTILFLFSLSMIFGASKPEDEIGQLSGASDRAIFPLAIPSIASPGAILAVVLMTDSHRHSVQDQLLSGVLLSLVLLATLLLLLVAERVHTVIGTSGASLISRVMGLLLAAVATNHILQGVTSYFGLTPGVV